jgi:hypothetical protein
LLWAGAWEWLEPRPYAKACLSPIWLDWNCGESISFQIAALAHDTSNPHGTEQSSFAHDRPNSPVHRCVVLIYFLLFVSSYVYIQRAEHVLGGGEGCSGVVRTAETTTTPVLLWRVHPVRLRRVLSRAIAAILPSHPRMQPCVHLVAVTGASCSRTVLLVHIN